MTNPLVTVIIPVYNGAKYVGEALASVAEQIYRPLEVIVVDDGSTDATADVVAEAQRTLDIAITYHHQANQGPSVARNLGIQRAQGPIVAFLDADDLWHQDKLARQVAYLTKHPECGCVVCRNMYFLEEGTDWPRNINRDYYDQGPPAYIPSALVVRGTTFERVGVFDPALRYGEDTDWFFRVREADITIGEVPEILLRRRFHQSNLSYTPEDPRKEMFERIRASLRRRAVRTGPGTPP